MMTWETAANAATVMGIGDVSLKYATLVLGTAYLFAFKDGFEIVYTPMQPSKKKLDDVKQMLNDLDDDDKQIIMECCESSDKSLAELWTEYKNCHRTFETTKFERSKCWKATLLVGNVTALFMPPKADLALIERRIGRLHHDTMTTTNRAHAIKTMEEERRNALSQGQVPADAEAGIPLSGIKTNVSRPAFDTSIQLHGPETVRAVVLFNE